MRCFFKFIRLSRAFVLMERVGYAKIKKMYREDNMGPEIYHIFIVCGIIAKEWRKEMSNAPKNKEK